ncbi:MAG: T9SS type A sorting domain-containing protein [Dysgonamonadaceae bacterium]|nr:T9SS type A sorting domain-containing protein [Dysgonamonadaceae bacterium]
MNKKNIILTLCIFCSPTAFPQSYSGGSGTVADPYLISSKADMEALAAATNSDAAYSADKYFRLTRDISDVITTIIGNGYPFMFKGAFDGGGHKITVNINATSNYVGVFGQLSGGAIKNLRVDGSVRGNMNGGNNYTGGICGYAGSGSISNCYNGGAIFSSSSASYATTSHSGGICGNGGGSAIINCYNTGTISTSSSTYSRSGGICGYIGSGSISNCYNAGTISPASSATSFAGGICGSYDDNAVNISNCYNAGAISASNTFSSYTGGICGRAHGGSIINCYNTGAISALNNSTYSSGGISGDATEVNINNCFAANATITCTRKSGSANYVYSGRIVGTIDNASLESCYALASMQINGATQSSQYAHSKDGKDENITSFQSQSWLEENLGWNFNTVWFMLDLPHLLWEKDLQTGYVHPAVPASFNPADDQITLAGLQGNETLRIYSISGNLLLSDTATGETTTIDIARLPAGIYLVGIQGDRGVVMHKFIKQ